ncbi:SWIM zinc finger family protein [Dactylosporangium sp. CA-139114]|uniref:SWIM zinc finger family protein n=1 Tax=Dactylosporangium sp. CA-139114 TaxID=3239931 RepID=UPI003D99E083
MSDVEQAYRYLRPSTVDDRGTVLSTSGGPEPNPSFYDGLVEHAEPVAAALLAVARIARTRFYTPPNMVTAAIRAADPLVTADAAGHLRFEALSACCGVYGRLDLLPEALESAPRACGTTNVDVNAPMREALAGIGGLDPMRLAVGADELRLSTLDGDVVERRVPLPERWVRSLAEVHVLARAMGPGARYPAAAVRRFLQALPRGPQHGTLFAAPSPVGPRLSTRPVPGAVGIAGLDRLRVVEPLLRRASGVRTFGLGTASAWVLDLPGARFTAMLSPAPSRAFCGEGGILDGGDSAGSDSTGGTGFDLADGVAFERVLPLDALVDAGEQPRLRDARALVAAGAVHPSADGAVVHSGGTPYTVRATDDGERCTCRWFAQHGLGRGPCKHILAVRLSRT